MGRSKKDPNQIIQQEHDDDLEAKKVSIVSADISIELDADDGDSVQTQGRLFEYSNMQNDMPVSCAPCKEVKVYIKTLTANANNTVRLHISADSSGDSFVEIAYNDASAISGEVVATPKQSILAQRMKVTGVDGDVEVKILGRG